MEARNVLGPGKVGPHGASRPWTALGRGADHRTLLGVPRGRLVIVLLVALAAIGFRLVKDDLGAPANLELVTVATFVAMALLRRRAAMIVPLACAVVSDLVLGNTSIALFTWSAWAVIGIGALAVRRPTVGWRRYAGALGFGAGASVWFYLWTNFGVWLLGRGTWYPPGLDGLAASYVAGLPFARPMLLGNLILLPLAAAGVAALERWEARRSAAAVLALG